MYFQFQVIREEGLGLLPKTVGHLFVGQSKDYDARTPFSQIKVINLEAEGDERFKYKYTIETQ